MNNGGGMNTLYNQQPSQNYNMGGYGGQQNQYQGGNNDYNNMGGSF